MSRFVVYFVAGVLGGQSLAAELQLDFNQSKVNAPPPGFRSSVTGTGQPGDWRVMHEEIPPLVGVASPNTPLTQRVVLAQLDRDPTDEHFPLLIYERESFWDFKLSARFKTMGGAIEQMAGIAFRIQDETNYYVLRASSLGNTFKFYKVVNGQRGALIGPEVEIPKGVWHEMSVQCEGNSIRCSLNGKEVIPPLTDNSFSAGKIGFWTKSDSVSYFTDVKITYAPRELPAQGFVRDALKKYPRLLGLKIYAAKGGQEGIQLIASSDAKEIGQLGQKVERAVIERDVAYYGKEKDSVLVTLPLHDRNGEAIAAVRVVMKSFPGQTEQNALVRALPIVKQMEARVRTAKDLIE